MGETMPESIDLCRSMVRGEYLNIVWAELSTLFWQFYSITP